MEKDGYETINDYSLLEQVRDAIEDTESTKTDKNIDITINDKILFNKIITKMNVKSHSTKERIKGAILELNAHKNYQKHDYKIKQKKSNNNLENDLEDPETTETLNNIKHSDGYNELIKLFRNNMSAILTINKNTKKSKKHLFEECSNENCEQKCNEKHSFIDICPCIKRIDCVLNVYQKLKDNQTLWGKVSISSIFCIENMYGFQQLVDDFLHLRIIHLESNELNTIKICESFEQRYACDLKKCNVFARHYRDRTDVQKSRMLYYHNTVGNENNNSYGVNKTIDIKNDKDIIFEQEIDKIHSYFLHSTLKFGKGNFFEENIGGNTDFDQRKNDINAAAKGRSYSKYKHNNKTEEKMNDKKRKVLLKARSDMNLHSNTYTNNKRDKPPLIKTKTHSLTSFEFKEWNEVTEVILAGRKYAHQSVFETGKHFRNNSDNTSRQSHIAMPKRDSLKFSKTGPLKRDDTMSPISKEEESDSNENNELNCEYQKENNYVGISEDKQWLSQINTCETEEEIYNKLVQFCGIFRWQNAHGFRSRHFQALGLIQARFLNIKDEVLHNDYHSITVENWNQTLRKSKAFAQSWAANKIRALYDGQFEDQITLSTFIWKQSDQIELREIVTLKLYTDFDKLQFELKKCFRWEYTQEVIDRNSTTTNEETKEENNKRLEIDNKTKFELLNRLQQFYHWRQSLVVILNKYGHKICADNKSNKNKNPSILYHGVNAKMILNPSITPAFYGPLSTSSSFHVAKTFATDKGMVLTISSQYPKLGICRAFDASLISDYPEEQEWLIGFIYTRIRKIHTKETFEWKRLPPASNLRFVFFALHLFRMQMFSMSDDLEEILIAIFLEKESKTNKKFKKLNNKKTKILKILQNKFDQFRKNPNTKQIIRLDDISPLLRKYFLDEEIKISINQKIISSNHSSDCDDEEDIINEQQEDIINDEQELDPNNSNKKYSVSFDKIKYIFPNLKEIHFYNYYKCDNQVLQKLIKFIQKKENKKQLKQIKFLYYDYNKDIINNNVYFYDPKCWDKYCIKQLNAHGYTIKHNKIMHYGYKIRIYKN